MGDLPGLFRVVANLCVDKERRGSWVNIRSNCTCVHTVQLRRLVASKAMKFSVYYVHT